MCSAILQILEPQCYFQIFRYWNKFCLFKSCIFVEKICLIHFNDVGAREGEEIPESVTAELEKLEQEGGISEAEEDSAMFGDIVEDDDELLG